MKLPCVILAGGQSSRMGGGDKGLLPFMGKPLLAHVLARIAPQCGDILLNTNSDPRRFRIFGMPIAGDVTSGFLGPLAGLLTGLRWARAQGAGSLVSVPCDTPFLPRDLVARLAEARARSGARIAIAADGMRSHPVIGLWDVTLAERLEEDLRQGTRAIYRWLAAFPVHEVDFAASHFQNINTPQDLQTAGITGGEMRTGAPEWRQSAAANI